MSLILVGRMITLSKTYDFLPYYKSSPNSANWACQFFSFPYPSFILPLNDEFRTFQMWKKIEKDIEEICGKSTWHGSFSWLVAVTVIFSKKQITFHPLKRPASTIFRIATEMLHPHKSIHKQTDVWIIIYITLITGNQHSFYGKLVQPPISCISSSVWSCIHSAERKSWVYF